MTLWYCDYCGYSNTITRLVCRQCGHPKPTPKRTYVLSPWVQRACTRMLPPKELSSAICHKSL